MKNLRIKIFISGIKYFRVYVSEMIDEMMNLLGTQVLHPLGNLMGPFEEMFRGDGTELLQFIVILVGGVLARCQCSSQKGDILVEMLVI